MERRRTSRSFKSTVPAQSIGGRLLRSLRLIFALIGSHLQRLRRRSGPAHLSVGKQGERIAADYLKKNGYRILYRNFRSKRGGEIDLVCRDCRATALVFVEVKTSYDGRIWSAALRRHCEAAGSDHSRRERMAPDAE